MRAFLAQLKQGTFSLACLNSAQFLGALNDNIFKLAVVFLLIQIKGPEYANPILSMIGALFVVPFLLFSSTAGILADSFSKRNLLMTMKVAEMILMVLAIWAFAVKSIWASYLLTFVIATHSALFGPSKYGIIPEIVPAEKISKANGLITSCTYIAVILGSFLASFLAEVSHYNFILIASVCLLIAIGGFLSTFGIKTNNITPEKKKFNPFFIREIYYTLRATTAIPHLLTSVCGSAFFLFMGSYLQLNIIPYTLQNLHKTDVVGGYLLLASALGIVMGALIAGQITKKRIELGLCCVAGIGIAVGQMLLGVFTQHVWTVAFLLIFLGLCGGVFLVPFDVFIQTMSPQKDRGQIIGAVNFLSFFGVLLSCFALYFFGHILQLSPSQGFVIMGIITLFAVLFFSAKLSDFTFALIARFFIKPFFRLEVKNEKKVEGFLVLQDASFIKALLLLTLKPDLHFLLPPTPKKQWINLLFYSIHQVTDNTTYDDKISYCLCTPNKDSFTFPTSRQTTFINIDKNNSRSYTLTFK